MNGGVPAPIVVDTFAEAFPMTASRLILTADTLAWADTAARVLSGYGTSVIGCDAEVGVERVLDASETPDGRPGVSVLAFAFNRDALEKALVNRVGQCVMTCATSACYSGLAAGEKSINIGGKLRYFGDCWQKSKLIDDRRFWRIPVMDGEFLCEETFGTTKGVAGGNLILIGPERGELLRATEHTAHAIRAVADVILPFPGGIARSGSKVGSKYSSLRASTNTAFAPTLRGLVRTDLPAEANAAYEIVIDGLTLDAVRSAMSAGLRAARQPGISHITAGNYGGKLGPYHIRLHELSGALCSPGESAQSRCAQQRGSVNM